MSTHFKKVHIFYSLLSMTWAGWFKVHLITIAQTKDIILIQFSIDIWILPNINNLQLKSDSYGWFLKSMAKKEKWNILVLC